MNNLCDHLSPAQAGALLGISSKRVQQLCDAGRLPCVRTVLGRLIPRAVVRDYAHGRGIELVDERAVT